MRKPRLYFLYLTAGSGLLLGQSYQGNLDSANCGSITGYASNGTSTPIYADFYDGATYLTSVLANQDTGSDSYLDGGYHGFSLPTPLTLKDNQIHSIYVRYGGTTINLGSDPRTIQCDSSSPGYQYYFTDTLQSINTTNWTQNGTLTVVPGWGLRATASGGGSLISKVAVQGPSSTNYEVNMTVALNASGGDYVEYVRATANALTGTGSYFSVELQNPTFNSATGACTATLAAYQSVNSVVTKLYSTPVACHNGMQVRTAILGTVAYIILDGNTMWVSGVTVASGMPGIGGRNMPSANAISLVMLGPWDNVAPSAVNAETIAATVNATSLYAQWQGAVDNANGVGVALYAIERNDGAWFYTYDASFSDLTVQPGTTYTYGIIAQDYHRNDSTTTSFTITTPPAGTLDPRRVGVRPTGSYWGGAGEQIDLLSGNVNFSLPLITAVGRGGLTAAFNLSYNSQNWVTGSAGLELMGVDTGYGFGWQLMLGSLMPVYSAAADPVPVQYYLFTDSTGAQYHLNQNSGSVWSSSESVYVWYDANANLLHFRNGTFWVMGCASAGGEPDAGTLYPTVVEDTNGNQIIITYMPGVAANWINSSARISIIEDARAVPYQSGGDQLYESYTFSYVVGGNGLSYLQYINSWVGTPETYSFGIAEGQPLYSPTGVSYGTTSLLSTVTTYGLGYTYNFTYDTTLNDGDLTQAEFPQGGHLRWTYANLAFGTQTLRYAASRYLLSTLGGSESTYTLSPGTNTMTLDDPTGSEKYWVFNASGTTPAGLVSELRERAYHGATQAVRHEYYTWAQDATSLNMYLGTLKTVLDEGQAYAQTTQTVQTQDSYGNVLTSQVYDYGNLNTPARTYSNTYAYQGNGSYASWYIYNRLSTSTLTSVTPNITLVSNTYDANTLSLPEGNPREWDAANYGSLCYYRGNVTQSNTPGKTINTFYDTTGTVTQQNDNNGHSVSVNTSSLTNFTLPDTLSPNGASTLQTQAAYNTPNYFPASIAGPGQTLNNGTTGTAAYTSYDSYGRIAYTLAPSQAAGQTGAQTNYTYGYSTSTGWTTTATTTNSGSGSHYTTTTLDGLGRTASVQSGTGSTPISEVDTAYAPCACSPMGKMYQRSQPYAPPNSSPPATAYTYDALGRTIKVLLADGASYTTYAYQGNFTTITDPAGKWKQYANDAFGNLVMVLEPDPTANPVPGPPTPSTYPVTSAPTGMLLTTYTYDQLNHLTQVAMPRNTANGLVTQTRTFVYTPTSYSTVDLPALWLTSATNPENGAVSYTYNADGTLASKTDANGNTESYQYDAYQRLTAIPDRQQTFTYDTCPAGATGCVSAAGQLMQATFGSGIGTNELNFEYNYSYTPAGKVSGKTLQVQSANHVSMQNAQAYGALTASYAYDGQGALTSVVYPTVETWAVSPAQTFAYSLDAMERPTAMTDQNNLVWASGATYNAANQPLYDGTATRTYNNLLQMTSIAASGMSMTYNYSSNQNNGQITSSVDAITGETITYQYDALKRLLSASGKNWGETYTYDGYGNLTQMSPSGTAGAPSLSLTVALNSNNVPTNRINATGVSYDNNGNQTAGFGGLSMTYDLANRVSAVGGSQSAAYAYDSDNLRIYSRNASGSETIYFFGADGKKLAAYTYSIITYDGNPEIQLLQQSENVYFLGKLISAEGNPVTTDRLGSVRSGGPGSLGYQAQYPYGVEYTLTANDREKYATYTRDSVTGLDYAMNRYYASQWGRFLSPDPYGGSISLRNPQSWNRYSYAGGDPADGADPSGLLILPDGPDGPGTQNTGDGSSGCPDGVLDPSDPTNLFGGMPGLPMWPFGGPPPWCGQGFLPWGGGFGGSGGGGGGGAYQSALSAAIKGLKSDLAKTNCAKDFKSVSADLTKLGQVGFSNYGQLTFITQNGNIIAQPPSVWTALTSPCWNSVACYNSVTKSINLNTNVNWDNPNNTAATLDGSPWIWQGLAAEAQEVGAQSVNAAQFMDISILHELAHYNGSIGDPNNAAVEKQLWNDCIN